MPRENERYVSEGARERVGGVEGMEVCVCVRERERERERERMWSEGLRGRERRGAERG